VRSNVERKFVVAVIEVVIEARCVIENINEGTGYDPQFLFGTDPTPLRF
jgi:hypothetical protein